MLGQFLQRIGRQALGLCASETDRSGPSIVWVMLQASALCTKEPAFEVFSLLNFFHL